MADVARLAELQPDPRVRLTFSSSGTWLALDGRAQVVDDQQRLEDLWNAFADSWLPEGPESERATLVRVDVESAEYWDAPGGKVATALSFVKSRLTGDTLDSGHGTLDPN